jgi:hypothetical protein
VAWADPELAVGAVALELSVEELEFPEVVLEFPVLELELREVVVLEVALEEVEEAGVVDVPVELVVSLECVDPGRAKATAPAIATLARPAPVVAARTLARARFLAAIASLSLSSFMFQVSALLFQKP